METAQKYKVTIAVEVEVEVEAYSTEKALAAGKVLQVFSVVIQDAKYRGTFTSVLPSHVEVVQAREVKQI